MHTHSRVHALSRKLREESGNCFLYGCVTLVVLTILGGLIAFLVARNFASQVREKYTEPTAAALPTSSLPAGEIQTLITRVDEYVAKLRAGDPLGTLTLTQDEVNALLQNHPDLKEDFGSIVYLTLGDGSATGQMSLPLDWLPMFGGRYFNGSATFDFEVSRGRPELYITGATVKGEEVPEQYMVGFGSENLAQTWQRDHEDVRTLLENIESVVIVSSTVVITPKNLAEPALVPILEEGGAPAEAPSAPEDAPAGDPAGEPAPPAN